MTRENTLIIDEGMPPWDTVLEIADAIDPHHWILVGGLMVQMHAMLHEKPSRSTKDVDVLIDLMATGNASASHMVGQLENIGFSLKEPGFRNGCFHRLERNDRVIDILVADHLPSRKLASAKIRRWQMLETPGGAQAVSRRMDMSIVYGSRTASIQVPNLLGAIVMKAAAYAVDGRDRSRHLDDIALLCSLVADVKSMRDQMRGSDAKRLRFARQALIDENHASWLLLDQADRQIAQDVLRILSA